MGDEPDGKASVTRVIESRRRSATALVGVAGLAASSFGGVATADRVEAHPTESEMFYCSGSIRWWESGAGWDTSIRSAMGQALNDWYSVRQENGSRFFNFQKVSGIGSGDQTRDPVAVNLFSHFGADGIPFAICSSLGYTDGRTGNIFLPRSSFNGDSPEEMRQLFRHEWGHVLGLPHTGNYDNTAWPIRRPTMSTNCPGGPSDSRGQTLTADDLGAVQYNRSTISGAHGYETFVSGDPSFENPHVPEVFSTYGSSLAYDSGRPSPGNGQRHAVWAPGSFTNTMWTSVRLSNMNEVTDGGHSNRVRGWGSFKPHASPQSGWLDAAVLRRHVVTPTSTNQNCFPLNLPAAFLFNLIDTDPGRSYNTASANSQWVSVSVGGYAYWQFQASQWALTATPWDSRHDYSYDYQLLYNNSLADANGYGVTMDVDRYGVTVEY